MDLSRWHGLCCDTWRGLRMRRRQRRRAVWLVCVGLIDRSRVPRCTGPGLLAARWPPITACAARSGAHGGQEVETMTTGHFQVSEGMAVLDANRERVGQ